MNLHCAKRLVPEPGGACNTILYVIEAGVPLGECRRVRRAGSLAEHECDATRFPRRDLNRDLKRGARIEAGTDVSTERLSKQSGWRGERPVSPDEIRAIASERAQRFGGPHECDAVLELRVVRVSRKNSVGRFV